MAILSLNYYQMNVQKKKYEYKSLISSTMSLKNGLIVISHSTFCIANVLQKSIVLSFDFNS